MNYFGVGSESTVIDAAAAGKLLDEMLAKVGPLRRVLLVPPDISRMHSWAGHVTCLLFQKLTGRCDVEVMPAIGTHEHMSAEEIAEMYPTIPLDCFRHHEWRHGVMKLGSIPAAFVRGVSKGQLDFEIEVAVGKLLVEGGFDRVFSIGQLVPHEVIGIANHNKNIFIGLGGSDAINKSHYLSGVIGLENIMGRADNPVRSVLNKAAELFGSRLPPISYVLTVRGRDEAGKLVTRGMYAGDDLDCFWIGSQLSRKVNITVVERPIRKAVVYLEPREFKSTWLGNKSVYRTRLAIADGGELLVLAPGVRMFGEDRDIDELIRRHGYVGTPKLLALSKQDPQLAKNLSATAHLIHGSSEGRFRITYAPGHLSRAEIESVGYRYADLAESEARYDPHHLTQGWNRLADGEEIYFVPNPGQGLWTVREKFEG